MNRRTFITACTAAAIGFGADSILTASAQEKEPMDTSTQSFWPDKARLVIFIYHIDDISRDEPFTVTVKGKPFAVVPYTVRNNDIVRFDSPATTNTAYLRDVKDDFDVLYEEAAHRRRMMSISTHDRISGIPGHVKLIEEFIKYAQKQQGVVFMRKDEIAKWALSAPNIPHKS